MVTAGDFKNGITLEMDNAIWQIIEFQHVKPGKGAVKKSEEVEKN